MSKMMTQQFVHLPVYFLALGITIICQLTFPTLEFPWFSTMSASSFSSDNPREGLSEFLMFHPPEFIRSRGDSKSEAKCVNRAGFQIGNPKWNHIKIRSVRLEDISWILRAYTSVAREAERMAYPLELEDVLLVFQLALQHL
jgi:hypothetical protein